MKPFILLSVFVCLSEFVGAQIIRGHVRDWKTGESLAFANVYINQTTMGAAADTKGNFVITCPPGSYELKASFVGYETETRKIVITENETIDVRFALTPSLKELTEVEVTGKRDRKWLRNFRHFKREFLGVSPNASDCEIVNPWVLEFDENEAGLWLLRATAQTPLEIVNKALGYRLFFHIRRFEVYKSKIAILGDTRFEELPADNPREQEEWISRRRQTYLGSDRHFFTALVHGTLEKDGFLLYAELSKNSDLVRAPSFGTELGKRVVPYIIRIEPNPGKVKLYKIPFDGRVEIHYTLRNDKPFYRDVSYQVSWLETANQTIYVNENGIVTDPTKLVAMGYFRSLRVADLLPLDYQPDR